MGENVAIYLWGSHKFQHIPKGVYDFLHNRFRCLFWVGTDKTWTVNSCRKGLP